MSTKSTNPQDIPEVNLENESGTRAMEEALQSSFTILKIVIAVLVIYLLVFSNLVNVKQDAEGVIVLRFGKAESKATSPEEVYKAGTRFAWPYPIDEKVEITRSRPVNSNAAWHAAIGLAERGDDIGQRPVDASRDGYAVTMDDKIIHIKAEMTYNVSDPSKFAFAFEEATAVLQLILDNGVTFAASRSDLATILENPTQFAENVKSRAEKLSDGYDLGVEIERVNVSGDDVKLPFMTKKAYEKFSGVRTSVDEVLSSAKIAADGVRRAIESGGVGSGASSGDVATIRNKAKNEAEALRASVKSLASRFQDIVTKYPDPVARRRYTEQLYYEAMERIAENEDIKIYLVSKGGKLNRSKLRLMINQPPPEVSKEKEGGER